MEIAKNQIDTTAKRRLSISLYLNYLVHGMGLIILAQNMNSLGTAWNQPIKIVSFVISGIGIGRLISYLITGFLSDKISRKFFVELGMFCYAVFALGMPMTKNIWIAYFFGSIASFTVPIITGMLSDINMAAVMAGDLVMAGIGILVAAIVMAAEKKG